MLCIAQLLPRLLQQFVASRDHCQPCQLQLEFEVEILFLFFFFCLAHRPACLHAQTNSGASITTLPGQRAHLLVHSTNSAQSCSQIKFNDDGGGSGGDFAQLSRLSIQTVTSHSLDLQMPCYIILNAWGSGSAAAAFAAAIALSVPKALLVSQPAARLPIPSSCVVAASLGVAAKYSFFFRLFQLLLLLLLQRLLLLPVAHMSTGNSAAAVLNSCLVFDWC